MAESWGHWLCGVASIFPEDAFCKYVLNEWMDESSSDISVVVSETARGTDAGQSPGLQPELKERIKKAIETLCTPDMLPLTPTGQGRSVDRNWGLCLNTTQW